jgi:hypothetical protein
MKIDLPPMLREELETRLHSVSRRRDPSLVKEVRLALSREGVSELSDAAVDLIRQEVADAVKLIEADKHMSNDPYLKYHKDALKYALNNVLIASLVASIGELIGKA